jgi:signal transduction histidine kinase
MNPLEISFNIETISLAISGLINLVLLVVISKRDNKNKNTLYFIFFSLSVFLWVVTGLIFEISTQSTDILIAKLIYLSAIFIPLFLLLFIKSFPSENRVKILNLKNLFIPAIIIAFFTSYSNLVIDDVYFDNGVKIISFGKMYIYYFVYILAYFIWGLVIMFTKYTKSVGVQKSQLEVVFISILVSSGVGVTTNLILPTFKNFNFFWIGPFFSIYMVATIGYSIIKYNLFNTKIITTEILTFFLWTVVFIRTIMSPNIQDMIINGTLLTITIVIGIFLIKGVMNELEQKERTQKLAVDLEKSNARLRELDQQKSEFVSLASHQLRGPLTAVKGYASMLLEGDFGVIKDGVRDAMEKIYTSTQDLVVLVNDYLDVTRIEQGRMQYDFSVFDTKDLVSTIITELQPNIDISGNKLTFDFEPGKNYTIKGDQGKIKQVISNLLDNSNKYTIKGQVHVWLRNPGNGKVLISISDTGVGIHPDVLPILFEKFTRAPDASRTNIMGTGLGLYVAKKMIEAHRGRVWAESPGPDKGSTFFIELDEWKG